MTLEERIQKLEEELKTLKSNIFRVEPEKPIQFTNADGNIFLEIGYEQNNTYLKFVNAQGDHKIVLGIDGTDCGYMVIKNSQGKIVGKFDVEMCGARIELLSNQTNNAVLLHGDDSDQSGGWIKLLGEDDEEFILAFEE